MPPTTPPLCETHPLLASAIDAWRTRRGNPPPPRVTPRANARARSAFALIDADGSGALDRDEMAAALALLGCDPARAAAAIAAADADGSGELGFNEFARALAVGLAATPGKADGASAVPFELAAAAYARRRVLAALAARDGPGAVAAAEAAARALRVGEEDDKAVAPRGRGGVAPARRAAVPPARRGGWRHRPPPH